MNERRYGVKLSRGVVTHVNNAPITTRTWAQEVRRIIERTTGEKGSVVSVATVKPS